MLCLGKISSQGQKLAIFHSADVERPHPSHYSLVFTDAGERYIQRQRQWENKGDIGRLAYACVCLLSVKSYFKCVHQFVCKFVILSFELREWEWWKVNTAEPGLISVCPSPYGGKASKSFSWQTFSTSVQFHFILRLDRSCRKSIFFHSSLISCCSAVSSKREMHQTSYNIYVRMFF